MFSRSLLSFVLIAFVFPSSLAVTISSANQVKGLTYDYIIVGGGNAGLVLANRLTEDPSVSILVIEAGISDQGVIAAQAPFLGPTVTPNTPFDWNYTVTAQKGMHGRTFPYPRGKLLGGSSSANYLFHQLGTDEDWNRLASVSGDNGWSWANMKKYVQKHEKFVPPVDGHDTTGQFIPSLHGFKGVTSVSLPGNNQTIDSRVLATTRQLAEFPFNEDTSGGDHSVLGIGWLQSSAGGGVRSSSSTSYLANANARPGLTVVLNASVTKLLSTGKGKAKGTVAFRSVEFTSTPGTGPIGSRTLTATARKEVILSAGTVGTAQILQLSGIGDPKELKSLNINTLVANSDVGENLSDHTLLPNLFSVQGNQSFDHIVRNADLTQDALNQWLQNKTGLLANNVVNHFGFSRLPGNSSVLKGIRDPAAGPKSPHWELVVSNFYFNPSSPPIPPTGSFMTCVVVLISPTSRGTIKLKSNNPFDAPLIDPNYLTTDFDIGAMREAVKAVLRFINAPAWKDYVIGPFGSTFAKAKTDAQIEDYVRGLTTTIFHPVGTASMSSQNSKSGVVNPDLTVKGTEGLRVVDASVFPFIPSTHTQGPVYLLAERASDMIKQANH